VRTIRAPVAVVPAIVAAIGARTAGPLFVTKDGRRRGKERARDAWVAVLRRVGLPFRNLHQTRHSVASHLIAAGVPLGDVAAFLGDTVETVVKTYLHKTGADPTDALDKMLNSARRVTSTAADGVKSLGNPA
jgi:integrase